MSTNNNKVDKELEKLIFLFIKEKGYNATLHTFERDSQVHFDTEYFGQLVNESRFEDADDYLVGFFPLSEENKSNTKILLCYFELRKCYFLQTLDRGDKLKALTILTEKLRIFEDIQPKIYSEFTRLLSLNDIRENSRLSNYTQETQREHAAKAIVQLVSHDLLPDIVKQPDVDTRTLRKALFNACEKKKIIPQVVEEEEEDNSLNLFDLGTSLNLFGEGSRKRKRAETESVSEQPEKRQKVVSEPKPSPSSSPAPKQPQPQPPQQQQPQQQPKPQPQPSPPPKAPQPKTPQQRQPEANHSLPQQQPQKPEAPPQQQPQKAAAPKVDLFDRSLFYHHTMVVTVDMRDGLLLSASGTGEIYLWDIEKAKSLFTLKSNSTQIKSVKLSPFDSTFAVAYEDLIQIFSFDNSGAKLVSTFNDNQQSINDIAFSPINKDILASVSADKTIHLWNVSQERCVQTMPATMHNNRLLSASWTEAGLFVLSEYGSIFHYSVSKMSLKYNRKIDSDATGLFAQSSLFVTMTNSGITKWDHTFSKKEKTLVKGNAAVPAQFQQSKSYLFGSMNEVLHVWDKQNCSLLSKKDFSSAVLKIASHSSSDVVAVVLGKTVKLLSTKSGRCEEVTAKPAIQVASHNIHAGATNGTTPAAQMLLKPFHTRLGGLDHSPESVIRLLHTFNGRGVVSMNKKGVLKFVSYKNQVNRKEKPTEYLFNANKGKYLTDENHVKIRPFFVVTKNPHDYIFAGAGGVVSLYQRGTNSSNVNERGHMDLKDPCGKNGKVSFIEVNPSDNNLLGVGFTSGVLALYQFGKSTKVKHIFSSDNQQYHNGQICDARFSNKGKYLAAASTDGVVTLWDHEKPKTPIAYFNQAQTRALPDEQISMSFCGKEEASAFLIATRSVLTFFSLETKQQEKQITKYKDISAACFSGDGKYVFVCRLDGSVLLLEYETLQLVGETNLSQSTNQHNVYGSCIDAHPAIQGKQCVVGTNTGESFIVTFE